MKQGTANPAEDYCFIHKALRPVGKARRQIAAVQPSNSRPADSAPGALIQANQRGTQGRTSEDPLGDVAIKVL